MGLPVNLVAVAATVFLRNLIRRVPGVHSRSISNFSMSPFLVIAGGVFCYLTRNRHRDWIDRVRNYPFLTPRRRLHHENHRISENRVQKAKSWVERNFQGSRKLQQNAVRFIDDQPQSFSTNINTKQKASRFVPQFSCKNVRRSERLFKKRQSESLIPVSEIEEPQASTSGMSNVKYKIPSSGVFAAMRGVRISNINSESHERGDLIRMTRSGKAYGYQEITKIKKSV